MDCVGYLQDHGYTSIRPEAAAADAWTQRCCDSVKGLLFGEVTDSWFFGHHNPAGEQGRYLTRSEGVPACRTFFAGVAAREYPGVVMR